MKLRMAIPELLGLRRYGLMTVGLKAGLPVGLILRRVGLAAIFGMCPRSYSGLILEYRLLNPNVGSIVTIAVETIAALATEEMEENLTMLIAVEAATGSALNHENT